MYSPERTAWWLGRSRSPEYQTAYNVIAKHVRRERPEVAVDFGCGTGELMKRLYGMPGCRLVVGTDSSKEMLGVAYENLKSAGIQPRFADPDMILRGEDGVVLAEDNVAESRIADGISDVSVMTFPEIMAYCNVGIVRHLARLEEAFGPMKTDDEDVLGSYALLAAVDFHLARSVRPGGVLVSAEYDISFGAEHDRIRCRLREKVAQLHGMKLKSARFYISPGVWEDTDRDRDGCDGKLKGYRIFGMRKL